MQPAFAIVLLTKGMFGGAERRFSQLFEFLYHNFPGKYYFIITWDLYDKILELFPDYPSENLIPIGIKKEVVKKSIPFSSSHPPITNQPGLVQKVYRYINNYRIQKSYFREIDQIKNEKDIRCFLGVYNGILPLYFYLMSKKRDTGIIFCDMDSWFSEVLPKQKKYWYRKFSSFNYALENSDYIDFLSPFILDGVKKRGMKIKEESISITPCSFTDYSKCKIGDKKFFQAAFAGRLEKDKNPELFLEAAIILSEKYPEIIFHIMGEGRLSAVIKEKVKNSGQQNIIFNGFHSNPIEVLVNTSVFVSIQTTNNYPSQSVLEAMGCGNSIVATDVGDTRMFINEDNGILIDLKVGQLVNALETLYLDKELREKLGSNAYSYVRNNHTVEKMSDYYVSLFEKASRRVTNKKVI